MSVTKPTNAVVADPVQAAKDAFASGKDVSQAVYGTSTPSESPDVESGSQGDSSDDYPLDGVGEEASGEAEAAEGKAKESSETLLDELVPSKDTSKQAPKAAKAIEEIIITDESGRKKITIDWNDKEKLRKYVEMAAGMRKFQAERDRTAARLKEIEPKHKELSESWKAVEEAYSKDGLKGLVNLLANKADGYDQWFEKEYSKRKYLENASPAEKEKLDLEDRFNRSERAREALEKRMQDELNKVQSERETASQKSLESQIHPTFDKYRFAGKLGDPTVEHQLDSAIWTESLKRLDQYPENTELTSAMIDKEFRTVANTFRKIINKQADATVKEVIAQKKVESQTKAANKVMSGMRSSSDVDDFKKDMRGGNLVAALTSLMTGKVKL